MVSVLPRNISDHHVIAVELKRKMCYKTGRKEIIRPDKVLAAAKYLTNTPLFRELGIRFDRSWSHEENNEISEHESTCKEIEENEVLDQPINPGTSKTLLDKDINLIVMAPGEGKKPVSLIYDQYVEELAFIKVHGGQKREFRVKVSYNDIIKSEISRFDRRAMRADYLFTALKKSQVAQLQNLISTCLRKKSSNGASLLAGNLLDENYVNSLVQHDDGFRILKSLRNSPAHWESEKKRVLAMVRQFGVPSLFLTVSAAETKWPELLKQLKKTVDNENISLDDAMDLPYETKARLIKSDPFICATFFECRFKELRSTWKSPFGPFGNRSIEHFYYRIEFQQRGSPHAHMMLWLSSAPVFVPGDASSTHAIINFVDEIITCSSEGLPQALIDLQTHKHTHTCNPKPHRPCRFGIPFFPMDSTRLLFELDKDDPDFKKWKEIGKKLFTKLQDLPPVIVTFEQYLSSTELDIEEYILALRTTIRRPKIFLKRSPKDRFLNPFSKKILELQLSNMDIQYILDPFACAVYIVDYINKADRGMSCLLRSVVEELKQGNKGTKESLRAISNAFLNASEISAQEAIYCLSGLPMSKASESEIFINTCHPDQRVRILKQRKDLLMLNSASTDIFVNNILDHYSNRPKTSWFENMSLAYFAAYFTYSKKLPTKTNASVDQISHETCEKMRGYWIKLLNDDGFVRQRLKPRIIRFCRFNKDDKEKFCREHLMLYTSWRNEQVDLDNGKIQEKFENYLE